MSKHILLTIDDSFTSASRDLLEYLTGSNMGAVIFCTANTLGDAETQRIAIDFIRQGYILGNHTFSHPVFTVGMPVSEQHRQILLAEKIIDDLYERSGVPRRFKIFRFPGGVSKIPAEKFLTDQRFISPYHLRRGYWKWDADLADAVPSNPHRTTERLDSCLREVASYKRTHAILLSHDRPYNMEVGLFEQMRIAAQKMELSFMTNAEIHEFMSLHQRRHNEFHKDSND